MRKIKTLSSSFLNLATRSAFIGEIPGTFEMSNLLSGFMDGKAECRCSYKFIHESKKVSDQETPSADLHLHFDKISTSVPLKNSRWIELFDMLELFWQQQKTSGLREFRNELEGISTKIQQLSFAVEQPKESAKISELSERLSTLEEQNTKNIQELVTRVSALELRMSKIPELGTRNIVSLSSSQVGSHRKWNILEFGNRGHLINLQEGGARIDIGKGGHYLVTSRITRVSPSANHYSAICLNGTEISHCYVGGSGGNYQNSSTITEIYYFPAGSYIQVSYNCTSDLGEELQNRFSLIRLSELNSGFAVLAKWTSTAGGGSGALYNWNNSPVCPTSPSVLTMNQQTLTIQETGFYFVAIRCTVTNTNSAHYFLALLLNGGEIARSHGNGYAAHYDSFLLSEVFQFQAKNTLTVQHTFNGGHLNTASLNAFSILKITTPLAKFHSTTTITSGQYVTWNVQSILTHQNVFSLSQDQKTVIILKPGYYMISIRNTAASSDGNYNLTLRNMKTNQNLSRTSNNSTGGIYDSFILDEVLRFQERTELGVVFTFGNSFYGLQAANSFSIFQLSELD